MGKVYKIEDIKIAVQTVGEAGVEKDLTFAPEVLAAVLDNEDIRVTDPLEVHYELTRQQDSVRVLFCVKGRFHTACSRCLEEMVWDIDLCRDTTYLPALSDMPDDLEAERLSPEIGYFRKDIHLGEFIISELVLSLPLRYVCDESCKGLCPSCGADLNKGPCSCTKPLDPRFSKLKEFKKNTRR